MSKSVRIIKWVAICLVGLIIAAQFIRPAKSNPAVIASEEIGAHLQMNSPVSAILDRSCADCHSNKTRWPWYSNVAPVSWFVIDHVNHGRSHLNFSEWSRYDREEAQNLLRGICKEVESGAMPMNSYTRIHREASLSADDTRNLCEWAATERARVSSR